MTTDGGAPATSRVAAAVAALTSLGLGGIAALAWVAGHHRWDGPMTDSGVGSHGLHRGDVFAVVPIVVSLGLAWWCWTRGSASGRG